MKQLFIELFEYNLDCNQRLLNVFTSVPDILSEKSIQLINHVLDAHQIWNNRISPVQPVFDVLEKHLLEDLHHIDKTNYSQTMTILHDFDLNADVSYTNSRGQSFINGCRDILFHIINHSTYHRAQIATEFRACGIDPLVTDFVFYKRS